MLTVEERIEYLTELRLNREFYSAVIDDRIRDLAHGHVEKDDPKFFEEIDYLETKGDVLRAHLGIKAVGELMLCEECNGFYTANEVKHEKCTLNYACCALHAGKTLIRI